MNKYKKYIGIIAILTSTGLLQAQTTSNKTDNQTTPSSKKMIQNMKDSNTDLVISNPWYIAGPSKESQKEINILRKKSGIVYVTVDDNLKKAPSKEIELNVMITPSGSNDGPPTNLSNNSHFLNITYKSSHLIKIQARQGNESGTGCIHGGSHPRVDLPASPSFTTIKIPWSSFKQDGDPKGKPLDIHNICKLNFVNYNPVPKATLEITSVKIKK
ncbi:MAG: hypothetical protein ACWIPH_09160 [Ostreibacterium sp.]